MLKRLKDDALLLSRNTDAGVADREGDNVPGAIERLEIVLLVLRRRRNLQNYIALFRKLERVRKQVHQNLLQAFVVGEQDRVELFAAFNEEANVFVLRQLMEAALELISDLFDQNIRDFDSHHARFDLRQIQNVID